MFAIKMIAILLMSISLPALGSLVSKTVVTLGDDVITTRQILIEQWVHFALSEAADKSVSPPAEVVTESQINVFVVDWIVEKEALNLNVSLPKDLDVEKKLENVEAQLKKRSEWVSLSASSAELREAVRRQMISKDFLKFKMESLTSAVSDQEAQVYFEKNRSKFSGQSFSVFKENIKVFLVQQQLQDRLKAWFDALKRKYKVRNLQTSLEKDREKK